jgi:hypothetical protein
MALGLHHRDEVLSGAAVQRQGMIRFNEGRRKPVIFRGREGGGDERIAEEVGQVDTRDDVEMEIWLASMLQSPSGAVEKLHEAWTYLHAAL